MSILSGATRAEGGPALAAHLLADENEAIEVISARGLVGSALADQLAELAAGAVTSHTKIALYHLHFDPVVWDERVREAFWSAFEREFRLSEARYAGAIHTKHGRKHEHRVYDVTADDGRIANLQFDFLRREKIAVLVAYKFSLPAPPIKHSRAVMARLQAEGHLEAANTLAEEVRRPVRIAKSSPKDRMIEDRAGSSKELALSRTLEAWKLSDDARSFVAALASRGLTLTKGSKVPVVVDAEGAVWPLARLIGEGSRREGLRIKATEVAKRIEGLDLTSVHVRTPEVQQVRPQVVPRAKCDEIAIALAPTVKAAEMVAGRDLSPNGSGKALDEALRSAKAPTARRDGLERRLLEARQRLAVLGRPVQMPTWLLDARSEFAGTAAARSHCECVCSALQERLNYTQNSRPRGLWAWWTGRKKFHRRKLELIQKRITIVGKRLDSLTKMVELERSKLAVLELRWQKKQDQIETDRAEEREALKTLIVSLRGPGPIYVPARQMPAKALRQENRPLVTP